MDTETVFYAPDYLPGFACKCGACRSVCCRGWGITVSESEYFRLLGMNCSRALRGKLDCAFALCDDPLPQRYAAVSPSWSGDCRLLGGDGLCSLQRECGEKVLPEVCRRYPRAYRRADAVPEAVCSASCEAVVETLMRDKPLSFVSMKLKTELPDTGAEDAKKVAVRTACIEIIQNADVPLSQRLVRLGEYLCGYERQTPADAGRSLFALSCIIREFSEVSPSISVCGRGVLSLFADDELPEPSALESAANKYLMMREKFESAYPQRERWFENLAVNHMFYEQFPYADGCGSLSDAYASFCVSLALVKVTSVCSAPSAPTRDSFSDCVAAAYRYIEHSAFSKNADILLRRRSLLTPECLYGLAEL